MVGGRRSCPSDDCLLAADERAAAAGEKFLFCGDQQSFGGRHGALLAQLVSAPLCNPRTHSLTLTRTSGDLDQAGPRTGLAAMVLYELICLTRAQLADATVREIAKTAGATVINNGGVVRTLEDWGHKVLPKPIKKYQSKHDEARYFVMRFDANRMLSPELFTETG